MAVDSHSLSYRVLVEALGGAIRRAEGSLALILLTVTDLSDVQARLGFEASAALLQTLGERFGQCFGDRGMVLRPGDGSFCVLVNAVRNAGHAILAAEKLKQRIEDTMAEAALTIAPEIHIGIALCPRHSTDADALLRKAQLAAAAARKRASRLQVYDEDCAQQVLEPWSLGDAFVEALRSGALEVRYQPKIRIADGSPAGVEALLRWMRDGQAVSTPDVFIPLAEEAGLTEETTWYVLSNSLRQASSYLQLAVAVNITAGMLYAPDFLEMVRTALSTWSVKAGGLTLEITEGALIADFERAIARLAQLRELGVKISIDDFGTGYSSLSYFKKVPADELKIDKSFVTRMLADPADQHLVEAIIRLAHRFNLLVVAEGVEDQATLAALAQLGCDCAQGHLLAPALDAKELANWLLRHPAAQ